MDRKEFIEKADEKLKLVRTEYGCNQEKMADILGISKKTLVQIEKGRSSLGWAGAVVLCSIFERSEILEAAFDGAAADLIQTLSFQDSGSDYPKTMGGKIWWKTLEEKGSFKLQQNIVSQHYRILDQFDRRLFSSFELKAMKDRLEKLK